MNLTNNNTMIFAKEFDGKKHYRAGLSTKLQDGSYDKAYIDVRLPKGVELEDRTKINITKGFLTFYNQKKDGKTVHTTFYIVVQEFTQEAKKDEYAEFGTQITTDDLDNATPDLPF